MTSDSNGFRHQDYETIPDLDSYELIEPSSLILPGTDLFESTMAGMGNALRRADVRRIVLVHGTLAGTDALGLYGHWQGVLPRLSRKLKKATKQIVDSLTGDRGNYTSQYAELLDRSISAANETRRIDVERFEWSSENHHLGRADAAARLTDRLLDIDRADGDRVLLWGHSHAGNVFALMTHLLGHNSKSRERFFDTVRHFDPSTHRIDVPTWKRLRSRMDQARNNNLAQKLDVVTFGTPVRYGWEETGFDKLLHFVNHHPVEGNEPFRGVFPGTGQQWLESLQGDYGDFVQQTFVARTDLPPAIWSWDAWKANRVLRNLLESSELNKSRLRRTKRAVRVANTGKTLLVDYGAVDPSAGDIFGHAIYTDCDWLAFHMAQIVQRFYENN